MTMPQTSPTQDGYQPAIDLQQALNVERNKELTQWAGDQYRKIKNARTSLERQWYVNLSFYFGKQNIAVVSTSSSTNGFKLVVPKAPPWRVRLVINKIRGIIRNELSKIVSQKPRFTVVPSSTEDDDQTAARVAEQIFDSVYSGYKLKTVFRRAEWWTCITGTGFIKDYWNPNAVDKLGNKGDFCYEPLTPFHVFVPDFNVLDIEEQPFVIHATTKSIEWCRANYPGVQVNTNVQAASDLLDDAFMGMIGARSPDANNAVLCLEVWVKPKGHKLLPNGGMFTVLGDKLVQVFDKYPYIHGEYPFSKLDHIESGKFYGTSIIEDLLPVQKEYNRTRSQIIENKNRMAKIQLVAPRGSIEVNKVTSEPGQVILYTPGYAPPQPLALQGLPSYVLQEVQQLQQDMDDISGQHEISRGQNPSQVTAATALSYLQEQDDTKLAGTIESLENAVEKIGRHTLSYVSQYWAESRLIRNVGSDMAFDAHVFKGEDLKGNTDLRVESMSALPTSKAAKQAFIMDLIKMGVIQGQDGLQVLEIGGIEKVYETYLVDKRQAQRENLRMNEGSQVAPNDYDNHELHILTHNQFRKTQQFELLPDTVKAYFQSHVELHKAAIAAKQPPMPEMTGGTPGDPGSMGPTDPALPPEGGQPPLPPEGM